MVWMISTTSTSSEDVNCNFPPVLDVGMSVPPLPSGHSQAPAKGVENCTEITCQPDAKILANNSRLLLLQQSTVNPANAWWELIDLRGSIVARWASQTGDRLATGYDYGRHRWNLACTWCTVYRFRDERFGNSWISDGSVESWTYVAWNMELKVTSIFSKIYIYFSFWFVATQRNVTLLFKYNLHADSRIIVPPPPSSTGCNPVGSCKPVEWCYIRICSPNQGAREEHRTIPRELMQLCSEFHLGGLFCTHRSEVRGSKVWYKMHLQNFFALNKVIFECIFFKFMKYKHEKSLSKVDESEEKFQYSSFAPSNVMLDICEVQLNKKSCMFFSSLPSNETRPIPNPSSDPDALNDQPSSSCIIDGFQRFFFRLQE